MTHSYDLTYLLSAIIFSFAIYKRFKNIESIENGTYKKANKYPKYCSFISGLVFPLCLPIFIIVGLIFNSFEETFHLTISMLFNAFIHISVFYIIIKPFMPSLRQKYDAHVCATLWLIPNFLYLASYGYMSHEAPLFVISIPGHWFKIVFLIWFIGFSSIMLWHIISHLHFRRFILKNAQEITDAAILDLFHDELSHAHIADRKYRLMISPNIQTPLSIGLFKRSIFIALPDKNYSSDELRLIFRHEIVHICREDGWSKFSLLFFAALCWFNPMVWSAMKISAQDIELSCDESVLKDCDSENRLKYAELILNNASDGRGFTTCLSSTAKSMQYRLKNILQPKIKESGFLFLSAIFFILLMSHGHIALAYDDIHGSDLIFRNAQINEVCLNEITMHDDNRHVADVYNIGYQTKHVCLNEDLLFDYLSDLSLKNLTGNYNYHNLNLQKHYTFNYDIPDGKLYIKLLEEMIYIETIIDGKYENDYYYLSQKTDWTYLKKLIFSYPTLNVQIVHKDKMERTRVTSPKPINLTKLYDLSALPAKTIYTSNFTGSSYGFNIGKPSKATLNFENQEITDYSIQIESFSGKINYSITSSDADKSFNFIPSMYPAKYTITASFIGPDNKPYNAEFIFSINHTDK